MNIIKITEETTTATLLKDIVSLTGYSLNKICDLSGISYHTLYSWYKSNGRKASFDFIVRIMAALKDVIIFSIDI